GANLPVRHGTQPLPLAAAGPTRPTAPRGTRRVGSSDQAGTLCEPRPPAADARQPGFGGRRRRRQAAAGGGVLRRLVALRAGGAAQAAARDGQEQAQKSPGDDEGSLGGTGMSREQNRSAGPRPDDPNERDAINQVLE